jgi:cytochrome c oxidase cbb3-type subunit 3
VTSIQCLLASAALVTVLLSGCSSPHGRPRRGSETPAPAEVLEFGALYTDNCAGCHGADGQGGAAIALADPVYQGIADEAVMRKTIANGVSGTSMPAFAQSAGGTLTDKQIDVITGGMRLRWFRPGFLDGANPPPYAQEPDGDVHQGEVAFKVYCELCHGPEGKGSQTGSAITSDSFLALVSDQGLRTIVIAGRPELGAPDWRGNVPGKPMSTQDVSDVVTWLVSRRVQNSRQPYLFSDLKPH